MFRIPSVIPFLYTSDANDLDRKAKAFFIRPCFLGLSDWDIANIKDIQKFEKYEYNYTFLVAFSPPPLQSLQNEPVIEISTLRNTVLM